MAVFGNILVALVSICAAQEFNVFYNADQKSFSLEPADVNVKASDVLVCKGKFANDSVTTGWYRLSVSGQQGVADELMMEGAGYFEGFVSSPLIDDAIANYAMDTSNKTLMNDLRFCLLSLSLCAFFFFNVCLFSISRPSVSRASQSLSTTADPVVIHLVFLPISFLAGHNSPSVGSGSIHGDRGCERNLLVQPTLTGSTWA